MRTASFEAGNKLAPPVRYIRQQDVLARIGVSWVTLWRWEKQGQFPKRRKIGPRLVAWIEAEINEWCETREAAFNSEVGSDANG